MTDNRSPQLRSKTMAAVRQKDTGPEMLVRRLLHRLGYRYRLHRRDLPGKPDIAFGPRKKVVFVHGCFWHGHGCSKGKLPKSRLEYWAPKIEANIERDEKRVLELRNMGWESCVIWQCELKDIGAVESKLRTFLDGSSEAAA